MKRGLLAFVVLTVALWFGAIAPYWTAHDARQHAAAVIEREGLLSATEQAATTERLAEWTTQLSATGDALRRFDRWRTTPTTFAGRTFVLWDALVERSETIQLADDGVDAILVAYDALDALERRLEARATRLQALEDALQGLSPYPSPAAREAVRLAAAALREDVTAIRDQLAPVDQTTQRAAEALREVQAWISADLLAAVLPREERQAAEDAVTRVVDAIVTPATSVETLLEGLNADIAALEAVESRLATWWRPPASTANAS